MKRSPDILIRDQARLAGVHPDLAQSVLTILHALDVLGFGMFVVEGVRSTERQQALYAQGRTANGNVVTHADGVVKKSNHQVKPDGWGHAVDLAFLDDPTTAKMETYADSQPWALMGAMAESLGLVWGGRWTMRDLPHVEIRYQG